MKVFIRENCSYRHEEFTKDTTVEVGEETGMVLLYFNYGVLLDESGEKADENKDKTKKATQKSKQASAEKVSDG